MTVSVDSVRIPNFAMKLQRSLEVRACVIEIVPFACEVTEVIQRAGLILVVGIGARQYSAVRSLGAGVVAETLEHAAERAACVMVVRHLLHQLLQSVPGDLGRDRSAAARPCTRACHSGQRPPA